MEEILRMDGYQIRREWQEMEVQFVVSNAEGFVCRLVAGEAGFELSAQERALGKEVSPALIAKLSDFIVRHDG